jgi:hypothetical protein
MTSRTISAALLTVVALATLSCSKTQDTAPERRVFGDPPTILHVDDQESLYYKKDKSIECDFSQIMSDYFCEKGGVPNVQFQPGGGYPSDPTRPDSPVGGVFIEGKYSEITLRAAVTDPNSPPPPAPSNVLLVSASYPEPPSFTTETSLVMFDDGSVNKFKFPQRQIRVGMDCHVDAFGNCFCLGAKWDLTSTDETAGDGTYTRRVAIVDKGSLSYPGADGFLQDCIMRETTETPILATQGDVYTMKIEAVDRQGNLAAWPTKLRAVVGTSSFACNGDPCGCCIMLSSQPEQDPPIGCRGVPGALADGYPDGVCRTFWP